VILNILLEITILLIVLAGLIFLGSMWIIRHLRREFKKVYRIQSKFDIELRKLVNIMVNFLDVEALKKYHKMIIKKLSHAEKVELLNLIETSYQSIDIDEETNAYIVETYQRLQEIRRERDSLVIVYNDKLAIFPFNLYAKILKFQKFVVYTSK